MPNKQLSKPTKVTIARLAISLVAFIFAIALIVASNAARDAATTVCFVVVAIFLGLVIVDRLKNLYAKRQ